MFKTTLAKNSNLSPSKVFYSGASRGKENINCSMISEKWGTKGWVWVIGRGVPADEFAAKPVGAFIPCFLSQVSLSHSLSVGGLQKCAEFANLLSRLAQAVFLHYPSAKEIWQKYCFQKFHILRFF